jgi:hypothetical protein
MVQIRPEQFIHFIKACEDRLVTFNPFTQQWLTDNICGKSSETYKFLVVLRNALAMGFSFSQKDDMGMSGHDDVLQFIKEKLDDIYTDFTSNQIQFKLKMVAASEIENKPVSDTCSMDELFYMSVKLPAIEQVDPMLYVYIGVLLGYVGTQPKSESWKFAGECYNMRIFLEPLLASSMETLGHDDFDGSDDDNSHNNPPEPNLQITEHNAEPFQSKAA